MDAAGDLWLLHRLEGRVRLKPEVRGQTTGRGQPTRQPISDTSDATTQLRRRAAFATVNEAIVTSVVPASPSFSPRLLSVIFPARSPRVSARLGGGGGHALSQCRGNKTLHERRTQTDALRLSPLRQYSPRVRHIRTAGRKTCPEAHTQRHGWAQNTS